MDRVSIPISVRAPRSRQAETVIASLSAAGAIAAAIVPLVRLLQSVTSGLDISDEGFYLVSAAQNPRRALPLEGPWGSVLHYLYAAAGGNLVVYRIVSILVLTAAAALLGASAAYALARPRTTTLITSLYAISAGAMAAAAETTYYALHILSPGYDWLNLVAVDVTVAGLFLLCAAGRLPRWVLVLASVQIEVGLMLDLVSRVVTFLGLCFLLLVVLIVNWRVQRTSTAPALGSSDRLYLGALLVAVGVLFALVVRSPAALGHDLAREISYTRLEKTYSGSSLLTQAAHESIHAFHAALRLTWSSLALLTLIGVGTAVARRRLHPRHRGSWVPIVTDLAVLGATGLFFSSASARHLLVGGAGAYQSVPEWSVSLFVLALGTIACAALSRGVRRSVSDKDGESPRSWVMPLAAAGMALFSGLAFGLSSANGMLPESSQAAGLIWTGSLVAISMVIVTPVLRAAATGAFAAVVAVIALHIVTGGIEQPYRTSPTGHGVPTSLVRVGTGGEIRLTTSEAQFVTGLRTAAAGAGFSQATPIADFSPFNPGLIYLLDGTPPATAILGVHSDRALFDWLLGLESRSFRRRAWIVTTPTGIPLATAASMLDGHGPGHYCGVFTGLWAGEGLTFSVYRPC